jgi:phenylpropionate dioxygenase-like ring-hydroxylating dioxygenase large terminal subunit
MTQIDLHPKTDGLEASSRTFSSGSTTSAAANGPSTAGRAFASLPIRRPKPETIAFAREVVDNAARCADPVQSAQILPAEAYVSEEFWDFEKWAIYGRQWLFVGHVNQVSAPRDYLARTILDEPILITRDDGGKIHVLTGVCQHRGHPLVGGLKAQPDGAACQNARNLVCPYHGWAYNLDGTFIWAPEMEKTTPIEELKKRIRLPELRTEIFHGLIFINFDSNAAPFSPALAKLDQEISNFDLANMMPMPVRVDSDLQWNWKVHFENALEPYHTDYVHQSSHSSAPANLSKFIDFTKGDGQVMTTTDFASSDVDLFSQGGQANTKTAPIIATLNEQQRRRLLFVAVMPTFFAVFQPSAVMATLILPKGPGRMDTHRFAIYPKTTVAMPGFNELFERQIKRQGVVIQEDLITQTAVHAAHRSRFTPRGRLSWLEATIPQMNQWLLERYQSALDELDARA